MFREFREENRRPPPPSTRRGTVGAFWWPQAGEFQVALKAPLKKSIYSLIDLREILLGCNRRYLEFLSAIDDHSAGVRALDRLTEQRRDSERPIKGLNFFKRTEPRLLRALQRPEFNIHGVRGADLIGLLPHLSPATLSRQLRRLRYLGVIKRVTGTYRYYLTRLGRAALAAACCITEWRIVPTLAASM